MEHMIGKLSGWGFSTHHLERNDVIDEAGLQQLYGLACRARRDSRVWWLALVSALAALVSALAAWYAALN
jgi:hypothetical protein